MAVPPGAERLSEIFQRYQNVSSSSSHNGYGAGSVMPYQGYNSEYGGSDNFEMEEQEDSFTSVDEMGAHVGLSRSRSMPTPFGRATTTTGVRMSVGPGGISMESRSSASIDSPFGRVSVSRSTSGLPPFSALLMPGFGSGRVPIFSLMHGNSMGVGMNQNLPGRCPFGTMFGIDPHTRGMQQHSQQPDGPIITELSDDEDYISEPYEHAFGELQKSIEAPVETKLFDDVKASSFTELADIKKETKKPNKNASLIKSKHRLKNKNESLVKCTNSVEAMSDSSSDFGSASRDYQSLPLIPLEDVTSLSPTELKTESEDINVRADFNFSSHDSALSVSSAEKDYQSLASFGLELTEDAEQPKSEDMKYNNEDANTDPKDKVVDDSKEAKPMDALVNEIIPAKDNFSSYSTQQDELYIDGNVGAKETNTSDKTWMKKETQEFPLSKEFETLQKPAFETTKYETKDNGQMMNPSKEGETVAGTTSATDLNNKLSTCHQHSVINGNSYEGRQDTPMQKSSKSAKAKNKETLSINTADHKKQDNTSELYHSPAAKCNVSVELNSTKENMHAVVDTDCTKSHSDVLVELGSCKEHITSFNIGADLNVRNKTENTSINSSSSLHGKARTVAGSFDNMGSLMQNTTTKTEKFPPWKDQTSKLKTKEWHEGSELFHLNNTTQAKLPPPQEHDHSMHIAEKTGLHRSDDSNIDNSNLEVLKAVASVNKPSQTKNVPNTNRRESKLEHVIPSSKENKSANKTVNQKETKFTFQNSDRLNINTLFEGNTVTSCKKVSDTKTSKSNTELETQQRNLELRETVSDTCPGNLMVYEDTEPFQSPDSITWNSTVEYRVQGDKVTQTHVSKGNKTLGSCWQLDPYFKEVKDSELIECVQNACCCQHICMPHGYCKHHLHRKVEEGRVLFYCIYCKSEKELLNRLCDCCLQRKYGKGPLVFINM